MKCLLIVFFAGCSHLCFSQAELPPSTEKKQTGSFLKLTVSESGNITDVKVVRSEDSRDLSPDDPQGVLIMSIIMDSNRAVSVSIPDEELKTKVLEKMFSSYRMPLTPEQQTAFKSLRSFSCSMKELSALLRLPEEKRKQDKRSRKGVPFGASHNELKDWISNCNVLYLQQRDHNFGIPYDDELKISHSYPFYFLIDIPGDAYEAEGQKLLGIFKELKIDDYQYRPEKTIETFVDVSAQFPGGNDSLIAYLEDNLVIPESITQVSYRSKAYVRFVVTEHGEIRDVKILKGAAECPECDREAIRLVKAMPKWTPAQNDGRAVPSYFNLPISFKT